MGLWKLSWNDSEARQALSIGLQFTASYTFGHAFANSGTTLSGSTGCYCKDPTNYNSPTQTPRGISGTISALDLITRFRSGEATYGGNLNRLVQTLVGNWQLNGVLTFTPGNRLPSVQMAAREYGTVSMLPNWLPAPIRMQRQRKGASRTNGSTRRISLSPAALTEGNLGLQTNYGPPTRSLDFPSLRISRSPTAGECSSGRRASYLANTPQFNANNLDINRQDANFGRITATQPGTERHIQFELRLQF